MVGDWFQRYAQFTAVIPEQVCRYSRAVNSQYNLIFHDAMVTRIP
jgi:hypothetical protein